MQNAISLQITCHPRQSDRRGNQCPRLTTNHRLNPAPTIPPQKPKNQFQNIPRQNTPHHHPPIVPEVWRIICRCRSVLCVYNTLIINIRLCVKIPLEDKWGTKIRIPKERTTIKPFQKNTQKCRGPYLSLILLFSLPLGLKIRLVLILKLPKAFIYKFSFCISNQVLN